MGATAKENTKKGRALEVLMSQGMLSWKHYLVFLEPRVFVSNRLRGFVKEHILSSIWKSISKAFHFVGCEIIAVQMFCFVFLFFVYFFEVETNFKNLCTTVLFPFCRKKCTNGTILKVCVITSIFMRVKYHVRLSSSWLKLRNSIL